MEITNEDEAKLDTWGEKLFRWWGAAFRSIFILFIGILAYSLIDPQSIGDIPLSALTLKLILGNLFACIVAIGCTMWFFNFPEKSDNYIMWGRFGGWVALLVGWAILYWTS